MSREIKFRDFEPELKKMRYFNLEQFDREEHNSYGNIMQYTGFVDKNGKEIYDGDIVHISGIGNYEITDICQDFDMLVNAKVEGDLNEIVGNIYENPELITEVKND